MSTVRFTTEIGLDRVIHAPVGIDLAPGKADVIVVQPSSVPTKSDGGLPESVPEIARSLAQFAQDQNVRPLPSDYAINHDHYLHGAPKGSDNP